MVHRRHSKFQHFMTCARLEVNDKPTRMVSTEFLKAETVRVQQRQPVTSTATPLNTTGIGSCNNRGPAAGCSITTGYSTVCTSNATTNDSYQYTTSVDIKKNTRYKREREKGEKKGGGGGNSVTLSESRATCAQRVCSRTKNSAIQKR